MNTDLLILYGTVTGNARDCANLAAKKAAALGIAHRLIDMQDFTAEALAQESQVLAIVSTWGDGEPPDDAVPFYDALAKLEGEPLQSLSYSVFGLGDTNYDQFCACAKLTDREFHRLGAHELEARVDADVDYEGPFQEWLERVFATIRARHVQNV